MKRILLASFLLFFFVGCNADEPLTPNASLNLPTIFGSVVLWSSTNYDVYLTSGCLISESAKGPQETYVNQGLFRDASKNYISVAGVTINGNALVTGSDQGYLYEGTTTFNADQYWSVSGANGIPTFLDTIPAPAKFRITAPNFLSDSVSVGSGFTLNYQNPNTDSVYVLLNYDQQVSRAIDTTITDTSYYTSQAIVTTSTGFNVPSSMLANFPTKGILRVMLVAPEQKVSTRGIKKVLLTSLTAASTYLYLKP